MFQGGGGVVWCVCEYGKEARHRPQQLRQASQIRGPSSSPAVSWRQRSKGARARRQRHACTNLRLALHLRQADTPKGDKKRMDASITARTVEGIVTVLSQPKSCGRHDPRSGVSWRPGVAFDEKKGRRRKAEHSRRPLAGQKLSASGTIFP